MADVPFELLVVLGALAGFLALWGLFSLIIKLLGPRPIPEAELMEDPSRAALAEMVRQEPGIYFQEIVRRTRQPPHKVRTELADLQRARHVRQAMRDGQVAWYPRRKDPTLVLAKRQASEGIGPAVLEELHESDAPSLANLAVRLGKSEDEMVPEFLRLRKAGLLEAPKGRAGHIAMSPLARRALAEIRKK